MTHTPVPWSLAPNPYRAAPDIIGNGRRIAKAYYENGSEDREVDDNAEFIVLACNSHAELLEALQYGIDMTKPADNGEYPYRTRHTVENMHRTFMQAIARATPERKQEI